MLAVDVPSKSLLLHHADPLAIRGVIAKSRLLSHPDYNLAVHHTIDAVRVLRNIGIPAPAPIRYNYAWPGKFTPGAHQIVMAEFLTIHRRGFNLSEMGTEKTAASLWAADWLMLHGYVRKALIISPLSTLDRVWMAEIFDVLMHRKAGILHGTRERRLETLKADLDFYVVNHDGLSIDVLRKTLAQRKDIDLVIVDEASAYCNASTDRYKALNKMLRPDQRLWLMTGTPCANAPSDAWALARLVSPTKVPEYFSMFRRQTMQQVTQFKWAPKPDAMQVVYAALQPAVRFRKQDCKDLPPVTTEDRVCQLTAEQEKAVKAMRKEMQIELKTKQITAVNAADKISKLRQILCGAVKDPLTDEYVTLDHAPRLSVLMECIEQAAAKVFVIVPFKGIIHALAEEVAKVYTIGVLNGDVPIAQRNEIIKNFKTTGSPHVLLCHPQVMSHGLNLTEADMCVFYAPIYSNDQAQQVVERFNRSGQTRPMTVVRIGGHKLEWDIYSLIESRRLGQQQILDMYLTVAGGK
jgi:SNF2 family DNA or RNA helicase